MNETIDKLPLSAGVDINFFFQLAHRATGVQNLLARTGKILARIYKQYKLIYGRIVFNI